MLFFENLRTAVGRYAAGVHHLFPAASEKVLFQAEHELGCEIPPGYRDFLRSFNGATLFHETFTLFPAAELARSADHPAYLRMGDSPDGELWMSADREGRIYQVDDESPDPILIGSGIEPWLNSTLAREGLLVDREGEFRDVFTDDGMSLTVRRKRVQLGRRHDSGSALYLLEQAELSADEGDLEAAIAALRQAVELDPQAGPAWELLATLYMDTDQAEAGVHAAQQAAAAAWHAPLVTARQLLATRIKTRGSLRVL